MEPKLQLRHQLADLVCEALEARRWTQREAAQHLATSQARVYALRKGRLEHLSSDLLVGWLGQLGLGAKVKSCQLAREYYTKRGVDPYELLAKGRARLNPAEPTSAWEALIEGQVLDRDFPNFQPGWQLNYDAYTQLGFPDRARRFRLALERAAAAEMEEGN